jgi:hypothetical protein
MKKNEKEQTPIEPEAPIDMVVAMDVARELSSEMLMKAGAILNGSLTEEQQEKEMEVLLEEFNRRGNENYRNKVKEKTEGHDGSSAA